MTKLISLLLRVSYTNTQFPHYTQQKFTLIFLTCQKISSTTFTMLLSWLIKRTIRWLYLITSTQKSTTLLIRTESYKSDFTIWTMWQQLSRLAWCSIMDYFLLISYISKTQWMYSFITHEELSQIQQMSLHSWFQMLSWYRSQFLLTRQILKTCRSSSSTWLRKLDHLLTEHMWKMCMMQHFGSLDWSIL